ncbi:transcriptional activator protein [Mycobacterium tuberculosis]|nr:transcriptional activator protein [Mycobacterium tuberculosis]
MHSAHSPYYRLVALRETSPRIHELIREAARIALNPTQEWLDEFDRAILAANPSIAADPALATVVKRSNRAHLIHFAAANLRNPGAPVPANLGPEPLRMARDLVRVGLDALALDIYRIGQNVAWRRWTDIAFGLTSDPDELHELLDVPFRTANEFVDTTLAGITTEMQLERDKLTRDVPAERRKIVQLLIDGAPISREHAEARLGYPLDRSHTAAVIWGDQAQGDHSHLDRVADAFGHAGGCPHPLVVVAGAATRWVWVKDAPGFDIDLIHEVLHDIPDARIAIGATAPGIEGFRRSHRDALTTARMIIRLESPHRVAFFTDVEMVALLTENAEGADDFIQRTLGNLESASPALKTTLLTFINQQCNASRAARLLFTHRNTLMNRLETAQRLLPRPLADTTIHVASHSKPSSGGRSKPAILRQRKSRMAPRCVSKTAQHRPLRYGSSTTEPTVLRASRS